MAVSAATNFINDDDAFVAPAIHWLDRLTATLLRSRDVFARGWGDLAPFEKLDFATVVGSPARVPSIEWEAHPVNRSRGVWSHDGIFSSPFENLPAEAQLARVRWLRPQPERSPSSPTYVVFASSGDAGFDTRTKLWAPLVRDAKIGAILLENAMYGARKPHAQNGTIVSTVADLLRMNLAAMLEGRALIEWLATHGHESIGVAGFSMGGGNAAIVASTCARPIAAAIFAAGRTSAPVFTNGLLSRGVEFGALRGAGSIEEARSRLRAILSLANIERVPLPQRLDATVLVAGKRDGWVYPANVESLHAHWPASELRWLDTGHVGALLRNGDSLRAAARDAMARLQKS